MGTVVKSMQVCEQRPIQLPYDLNNDTSSNLAGASVDEIVQNLGMNPVTKRGTTLALVNGTLVEKYCYQETYPDIEIKPLRFNPYYIQVRRVPKQLSKADLK